MTVFVWISIEGLVNDNADVAPNLVCIKNIVKSNQLGGCRLVGQKLVGPTNILLQTEEKHKGRRPVPQRGIHS